VKLKDIIPGGCYINALPEKFDQHMSYEENGLTTRERLVREYAWAVPTDKALNAIITISKEIVEIGAGRGYWACLLSELGATVYAYDNASWLMQPWFDVRHGGPEKVELHPDAAVFICWPPYDDPMAFDVASRVRAGRPLIYVGEGQGGCNGDDAFWDLLSDEFDRVKGIDLPQWYGIYDALTIYVREDGDE